MKRYFTLPLHEVPLAIAKFYFPVFGLLFLIGLLIMAYNYQRPDKLISGGLISLFSYYIIAKTCFEWANKKQVVQEYQTLYNTLKPLYPSRSLRFKERLSEKMERHIESIISDPNCISFTSKNCLIYKSKDMLAISANISQETRSRATSSTKHRKEFGVFYFKLPLQMPNTNLHKDEIFQWAEESLQIDFRDCIAKNYTLYLHGQVAVFRSPQAFYSPKAVGLVFSRLISHLKASFQREIRSDQTNE